MKKLLIINTLMFFLSFSIWASESNSLVSHFKTQYAGELGVVSAGLGKKLASWYEFTLMYGHVPPNEEGFSIHTLAIKQDFSFWRPTDSFRTYFDLTILMAYLNDKKPTSNRKSRLSESLYNTSEGILGLGVETRIENLAFYFETGLLAHWLYFYYNNPQSVILSDMTTITFGLNYYF